MSQYEQYVGEVIDNVRLEELLGEGGMGAVLRGRHTIMENQVAVKIMPPYLASDPQYKERFFREAREASKLDHPNIVKITWMGEDKGLLYLVMEYVDGGNLAEVIDSMEKVPAERAVDLVLPIADALYYAHQQGIVHRDVKPENILLANDDSGNPIPKITDFGLVRKLSEGDTQSMNLTRSGEAIGTPAFMPIEQWDGQAIDGRADLYALGITLFNMLSGHLPIESDNISTIVSRLVQQQFTPLREVCPDVDPQLEEIVTQSFALRREQRQRDVGEFAAQLRAWRARDSRAEPVPVQEDAPAFEEGQTTLKRGSRTGGPQTRQEAGGASNSGSKGGSKAGSKGALSAPAAPASVGAGVTPGGRRPGRKSREPQSQGGAERASRPDSREGRIGVAKVKPAGPRVKVNRRRGEAPGGGGGGGVQTARERGSRHDQDRQRGERGSRHDAERARPGRRHGHQAGARRTSGVKLGRQQQMILYASGGVLLLIIVIALAVASSGGSDDDDTRDSSDQTATNGNNGAADNDGDSEDAKARIDGVRESLGTPATEREFVRALNDLRAHFEQYPQDHDPLRETWDLLERRYELFQDSRFAEAHAIEDPIQAQSGLRGVENLKRELDDEEDDWIRERVAAEVERLRQLIDDNERIGELIIFAGRESSLMVLEEIAEELAVFADIYAENSELNRTIAEALRVVNRRMDDVGPDLDLLEEARVVSIPESQSRLAGPLAGAAPLETRTTMGPFRVRGAAEHWFAIEVAEASRLEVAYAEQRSRDDTSLTWSLHDEDQRAHPVTFSHDEVAGTGRVAAAVDAGRHYLRIAFSGSSSARFAFRAVAQVIEFEHQLELSALRTAEGAEPSSIETTGGTWYRIYVSGDSWVRYRAGTRGGTVSERDQILVAIYNRDTDESRAERFALLKRREIQANTDHSGLILLPRGEHLVHIHHSRLRNTFSTRFTFSRESLPTFADAQASETQFELDELEGGIVDSTMLLKSGTYRISRVLRVNPGARLVIEAGTRLEFAGNAGFIVEGELVVLGREGEPVVFDAQDPQRGWAALAVSGTRASILAWHLHIHHGGGVQTRMDDTLQDEEGRQQVGGGILMDGDPDRVHVLRHCRIEQCRVNQFATPGIGGGLTINSPTDIEGLTIARNQADFAGAIFVHSGSLNLRDAEIVGNTAARFAGGLLAQGDVTVLLRNVEFRENHAEELYGGGAVVATGYFDFLNCTFADNRAPQAGALAATGSTTRIRVSGGDITGNHASGGRQNGLGGAIQVLGVGSIGFEGVRFANNRADGAGGAIWARGTDIRFVDCETENNTAPRAEAVFLSHLAQRDSPFMPRRSLVESGLAIRESSATALVAEIEQN